MSIFFVLFTEYTFLSQVARTFKGRDVSYKEREGRDKTERERVKKKQDKEEGKIKGERKR